VNGIADVLRNLGALRLMVMGAVAVGLVAFFIFFAGRVTQPPMALLYRGLDVNDAADIVAALDAQKVPYEIAAGGTEIRVPEDQMLCLRMSMAQQGLPNGGSVGYEIFDRSDGLGTTSFVQKVNLLRALEGELARTIRSLDRVEAARVHLVLPKREVFSRENRRPSASIMLKIRGGGRIDRGQVSAIQNLVAAAVPELDPGRISIVDSRGNLLARGDGNDKDPYESPSSLDDLKSAQEARIAREIEALLGKTVGFGKVRAQVAVEMDFDRVTTNSETYDPDGQVARSTQTVEEEAANSEGQGQDTVTVANNLPDAGTTDGTGSSAKNSRTEETVNFEISKTMKTQVHESGTIQRLSAAVLIDGTYTEGENGEQVYQPRSQEELDQLTALVRSGIGFNAERGDQIEVTNLRFAGVDAGLPAGELESAVFMGLEKSDLFRMGELTVLGVVAILVLLLVVRPLLNRVLTMEPGPAMAQLAGAAGGAPALTAQGQPAAIAAGQGQAALPAPDGAEAQAGGEPVPSSTESKIDLAMVEGGVKESSVKKMGEIIDNHPDEAVAVMRNWLYQGS